MTEEVYMRRAIALAEQGAGWTSPNPLVGAVVVKGDRIIGEGFHARYGELHAERNALAACTESPIGATLYVTLEPCCHHGKTPPCTDAILQAGIRRVVIGSRDPNPKVSGQGASILRTAGLEITEDFMRADCDALNPIFFHYISTKLPYVAVKYAMTADGKLATKTGASQWITGEAARAHVHTLRNRYRAILVGSGTVLQDDPLLTCRLEGGRNPIRVVCDTRLRIPLDSKLCQTAKTVPTIVATHRADADQKAALEQCGITVLELPLADGTLDLQALLQALGAREIDSILLEGGSSLHGSFLAAGLVQRLYCYLAPKIFGGLQAKSPVGDPGVSHPNAAILLTAPRIRSFEGGDLLLEYEVKKDVYRDH